ncbi:hypothetical protein PFISCL1PPCAC_2906, partial [Pristionchus fissidentatus]
ARDGNSSDDDSFEMIENRLSPIVDDSHIEYPEDSDEEKEEKTVDEEEKREKETEDGEDSDAETAIDIDEEREAKESTVVNKDEDNDEQCSNNADVEDIMFHTITALGNTLHGRFEARAGVEQCRKSIDDSTEYIEKKRQYLEEWESIMREAGCSIGDGQEIKERILRQIRAREVVVELTKKRMRAYEEAVQRMVEPIVKTVTIDLGEKKDSSNPLLSYKHLLKMAIERNHPHMMTAKEIKEWIEKEFPYYGNLEGEEEKGFYSCVRHSLLMNDYFIKVATAKKVLWTLCNRNICTAECNLGNRESDIELDEAVAALTFEQRRDAQFMEGFMVGFNAGFKKG